MKILYRMNIPPHETWDYVHSEECEMFVNIYVDIDGEIDPCVLYWMDYWDAES